MSWLGGTLGTGHPVRIRLRIPDGGPGYSVALRLPDGRTRYEIAVTNPGGTAEAVVAATVDGKPAAVEDGSAGVSLVADGGLHRVLVTLGGDRTA